jgi:hypothetical protein
MANTWEDLASVETDDELEAGYFNAIAREMTLQIKNLGRTLIDREGVYSKNQTDAWGDAYIDNGGRDDSVASATALFYINKYTTFLGDGSSITETAEATMETQRSALIKKGYVVTVDVDSVLISVTKDSDCTATKAYLYDEDDVLIGTATFSSHTATFSKPLPMYVGIDYKITADKSGSSYTRAYNTSASYPYIGTNINFISDEGGGTDIANNIVSVVVQTNTTTESEITHTIPSGTFPATISHAVGDAIVEDWETGANIQYKLTGTGGTEDTGWLDYHALSNFTAFTAEPDTMIVKLIPKTSSPTAGYPSIKFFGVRAW